MGPIVPKKINIYFSVHESNHQQYPRLRQSEKESLETIYYFHICFTALN
jgi:hypothetical protein